MSLRSRRPRNDVQADGTPIATTQANGISNSAHKKANGTPKSSDSDREADPGVKPVQAAPSLFDYTTMILTVFCGCCGNVWSFEQLLMTDARIGSALTFAQTLFIAGQSLPAFLDWQGSALPRLKPRTVPIQTWALQVLLHTGGSLLNNWAFAFRVPLTVQMIFRSAGLAVSMLLGYTFLNKRYTLLQITSVAIVTVGVVLTTLSKPNGPVKAAADGDPSDMYAVGMTMLVASLLFTGLLGMLQEMTYKKYGPCWQEGVFYTHFLSLPIYILLSSDVKRGMGYLFASSSSSSSTAYILLAANLITQLICVSGVNKLSSQVSSVSTNLVLTTRKAVSLCFSVWWFGNGWNRGLGAGAALVFLGSILFAC